jgi:hypothetical protein
MMKTVQRFVVLALVGLLLTATVGAAVASDRNEKSWSNDDITITFSTPATYHACPANETSDTIWTTSVPDDWHLNGYVRVQYVTDGGRVLIHEYSVDQAGDLNLEVFYPPVSEWPIQSGGTAEIHVDLSIGVYDADGNNVTWINDPLGVLGPGQDWDVFCLTSPPPPPPPPPPPGDEGCTPGYWKQPQHLDSWVGYAPSDSYETVFGVDASFDAATLLQVLKQGGGGEKALGRHAVAALLNASNPDVPYSYTAAEVIAKVQEAYATGDFEGAKNMLAEQNEKFCPLD